MPPSVDTEDGPQSATRHKQDRRPSNVPANRSEGRKSVTLSEKRMALERRQEEIRILSARSPLSDERERNQNESEARQDHSIGTLQLSRRIEKLEQVATQYETLQTRLVTIEGLLKPYAAYEQHALGAVEQLKQIETRLQTGRFSKTDTAIKQLVDKHEASLQEHSTRLQQLLDRNQLAKIQPQSTADLAKSLLHRLTHEDLVDEKLANSLRSALGGGYITGLDAPQDGPRQELTPVTDDLDTRQGTEQSFETPRPTKRPCTAESAGSSVSPIKGTVGNFITRPIEHGERARREDGGGDPRALIGPTCSRKETYPVPRYGAVENGSFAGEAHAAQWIFAHQARGIEAELTEGKASGVGEEEGDRR
ncbi:hypothetical protein LTR86_005400 [Recurvomyces mirabilis]|nr:hypothetical protein LTR86_005400 [Recurvomyces mirabilis]